MELKQQVTISEDEAKKILIDHLKKQGIRIDENSIEMDKRSYFFFALTLTEEEIYIADTKAILKNPFSEMNFRSPNLKNKLLKRLGKDIKIEELLEIQLGSSKEKFLSGNTIRRSLFENSSPRTKNKLTGAEENILIETFGELGINLKKFYKYKGGLH